MENIVTRVADQLSARWVSVEDEVLLAKNAFDFTGNVFTDFAVSGESELRI